MGVAPGWRRGTDFTFSYLSRASLVDDIAVKRGAAGLYRRKLDDLTLYSMGKMFETARTHELYSLSTPSPISP